MKLSELEINTDYAVVPSWTYSNKSARDVDTCRENDVVKATLISKDKYEYEPAIKKSDSTSFRKADAGNRSVGVIVKAVDSNGNEIYWTSRLADIVAPYSVLEPKWTQAKTEQQKRDEEERIKREKAEQLKKEAYNRANTARNSVIATSKELLGEKCEVIVDTEGYGLDIKAVVKMTLTEYERLIEMAYEGKASVA